jgi:ribose-phosphate pyrophosphokinase
MKILSGNSNQPLAEKVASLLGLSLVKSSLRTFTDKEICIEILEDLADEDVLLIQSTSSPVNDNLMELFIMLNAVKQCSPKSITAVIPYYGYSRQDRLITPYSSIGAEVTAQLFMSAGIHKIITVDIHSHRLEKFFNIPLQNVSVIPLFAEDITTSNPCQKRVIVSPDQGGIQRAQNLADALKTESVFIHKHRAKNGAVTISAIEGSVKDQDCIIIDDIVDTATTLCKASEALIKAGATSVRAYVTHGIFSTDSIEQINGSPLIELVLTDSVLPTSALLACQKIRYLSSAPLLAKAIKYMRA